MKIIIITVGLVVIARQIIYPHISPQDVDS